MKETHEYLVPDYYSDFSCKMGACRTACCIGWPVSITIDDYFKLVGVDCSNELRRRLDVALHLSTNPHPEDYARITPGFDGNCHLRMEDGRCLLQAELGEEALPHVCNLYPRGLRSDTNRECSCTNSCERVIELLFQHKQPITFHNTSLAFDCPPAAGRSVQFETAGREQEIRLHFIKQLQQRAYPLPIRLMLLSHELNSMDDALNAHDLHSVDKLLAGGSYSPAIIDKFPDWAHLKLGLEAASRMVDMFDRGSRSIRDYGEAALRYFGDSDAAFGRYAIARAHFDSVFPDWEIYFENMLVNHMFFSGFPFQDRPVSLRDEFIALCAVYALLRFLGIGWMADKYAAEPFVDVCAAAFRLIDHTDFDRYAISVLKSLGCGDIETMHELICL